MGKIANRFLGGDDRLNLVLSDGEVWVIIIGPKLTNISQPPANGKYLLLGQSIGDA